MVSRRSFTVTNNTIINNEGNKHDISLNSVNGENGLVFKIARTKINQNFLALKYDITQHSQRRYLRIIGVIYNVFIK